MPVLPMPPESPLAGGDLPVSSVDDVLQILPAFLKQGDSHEVRDAILEALTAMMIKYQVLSEQAVAMSDVTRSLDSALIGLGEDRGVFRQESETLEEYRARILAIPNIVTPEAIIAAINAILAPFTDVEAEYSESVQDRWFVGTSADRDWHSFVWDATASDSPQYIDRLYEDDATDNSGYFRTNSNPGGARIYADTIGRMFIIRIPDLSSIDTLGSFPDSSSIADRFYIGPSGGMSAVRTIGTTMLDIFNTIVSIVSRLKAHSIRYMILADPKMGV